MEIRSQGFTVYLKTLSIADAKDFAEQINDQEITKNVSSSAVVISYPYTQEQAVELIYTVQRAHAEGTALNFGIHLVDGDTFIGCVSFFNIDFSTKSCTVLYWLGRSFWGQGYAKQALRLLLAFGFRELKMHAIDAEIYTSNIRSIGLVRALGFKENKVLGEKVVFRMYEDQYNDVIKTEVKRP